MTQQQKTFHINRTVNAVAALVRAIATCTDVSTESAQMGYTDQAKGLQDSDFAVCGNPCTAADYRNILATLQGLDKTCGTVPNGGASVYQVLRQLSR